MTKDIVQFLEWDSDFFGVRIARIETTTPDLRDLENILEWSNANKIQCIYALSSPSDTNTNYLLENSGFRTVDIRVTLDIKIPKNAIPWKSDANCIRLVNEQDIPALKSIASKNHQDSRFYCDGNFSHDRCNNLFETWIEKSCHDYADAVLVVDMEGTAIGYLSCHLKNNIGNIGLVGIHADYHGRGYGQLLLQNAINWFSSQGIENIEVVTQGANIGAQRLYQQKGFKTKSVQLWHHYWIK